MLIPTKAAPRREPPAAPAGPSGRGLALSLSVSALAVLLAAAAGAVAAAAELRPETLEAYKKYIEMLDREFAERATKGPTADWLSAIARDRRSLHAGEIPIVEGGKEGMIAVPGGLIHDWRGTVFIPGARLKDVLAVNQAYDDYARFHQVVLRSKAIAREEDTFTVFLRIRKGTSIVTATLDTWAVASYRSPGPGVTLGRTEVEKIAEVQNAGEAEERHLPPGQDSGYLWAAHMYSTFLEQDGGVYFELRNIGLSRRIPWTPPPVSWLVAKIVKEVARGSIADTLSETRAAVLKRARPASPPRAMSIGWGRSGGDNRLEFGSWPA
ncbi:MAG: hypothetical protein ACE148_02340 [Vicinamibacterales bacterium]